MNSVDFNKVLIDLLDSLKAYDYAFKASVDGKPIIDFKNGKDNLSKQDYVEPEITVTNEPFDPNRYNATCTKDVQDDHCIDYINKISAYVTRVSDDYFTVLSHFAGVTYGEPKEICFSTYNDETNTFYPGVSEEDLLWILAYRFKDNKEVSDKIIDVLKSI